MKQEMHLEQASSTFLLANGPGNAAGDRSMRDLSECLPSIELENTPIGSLLPRVASELGLPENIPVSIGGGDNMMAAVGTGNVEPGVITMSLGTSGTVYGFSETPIVDSEANSQASFINWRLATTGLHHELHWCN